MANTNAPFGLEPQGRTLSGGFPEIQHMEKTAAEVVYIHDAVNQLATGLIEADSATPGTTLYSGIALGHGAANAAGVLIPVVISPDIIFKAQASDAFARADEGLNANLVLTAGGSKDGTYSKHAVNSATQDTTNSLDVKLRRLFPAVGNEYGNYAHIECSFNKHRNFGGVAGV